METTAAAPAPETRPYWLADRSRFVNLQSGLLNPTALAKISAFIGFPAFCCSIAFGISSACSSVFCGKVHGAFTKTFVRDARSFRAGCPAVSSLGSFMDFSFWYCGGFSARILTSFISSRPRLLRQSRLRPSFCRRTWLLRPSARCRRIWISPPAPSPPRPCKVPRRRSGQFRPISRSPT